MHTFMQQAPRFVVTSWTMFQLAWQAQPVICLALVLLTALQGVLPLATAWLTKLLFDLLALAFQEGFSPALTRQLAFILAGQTFLMLVGQMAAPLNNYLNAEMGRRLTVAVQQAVYGKISCLAGMAYFEDPAFHDTFRLAGQGAQFGTANMLRTLTGLLQSIITLVGFIGVLVAFSPLLAGLVALAALPQLVVQLKIGRQRFGLAFNLSPEERRAFYYGHLLSSPTPAKEIRLFGLADYFLGGLLDTYRRIHRAQHRQELRELRWTLGLEGLATLVSSGAFIVVVLQAFAGRLSLGDVTLYTSAVRSVQSALTGIVAALSNLNEQALFFSHYQRLQALPQPVAIAASPRPVPPLQSGIELRNVSFRYTEQHPWVLRHANLFIPAGLCLALVGLNGAGKTTLVKLLTRLYDPTEGEILWDGVDIREFDPQALRRRVGVIFQDFMRYELSARENIGLGDVQYVAEMGRIHQAAEQAGIGPFIEHLPHGYETILSRVFGENGTGVDLSGGEWQKVAIARLFMRQADLLILDEPTAALDAQAEHEIYSHFAGLVSGRTSLIISHRFSTVRMADLIAVLEDGQITECGSHQELLAQQGSYARLYRLQAERYREQ
jgi:ATP-binding cassette, subfamily B, bacterial